MSFEGLSVVWTPSPRVTQNGSFLPYVLMQLPPMFCSVMNRAVWLKNPILMRSFIISHFCLCAPSEKKLFCLLSPFQKYNGKPTRTAEVHICSSPPPLSPSHSLFLRLGASSIFFDPNHFFYPESIQI